jgi:hypothetical protein
MRTISEYIDDALRLSVSQGSTVTPNHRLRCNPLKWIAS